LCRLTFEAPFALSLHQLDQSLDIGTRGCDFIAALLIEVN